MNDEEYLREKKFAFMLLDLIGSTGVPKNVAFAKMMKLVPEMAERIKEITRMAADSLDEGKISMVADMLEGMVQQIKAVIEVWDTENINELFGIDGGENGC